MLTYLGQSLVDAGDQKPWYDLHPKRLREDEQKKLKTKEEWEAKKKLRADPLVQMNKVSEWFEKKREEKSIEEAKMLQRAQSCIAAMPGLFPNDISVPSNQSQSQYTGRSSPVGSKRDLPEENKISKCKEERKRKSNRSSSGSPDKEASSGRIEPTPGPSSGAIELAKKMNMDKLRTERLQRERKERERAALVMAKARGLSQAFADPTQPVVPTDEREIPFNSAFNPELSAALAARRKRDREARRRPYR